MNLEVTKAAVSLLKRGEDFCIVSILGTHGSSPRHSGAAMLVRADGRIAGTIGGGPLEARAIREGLEALATRESRVSEFISSELGMMCGGGGQLLIEYVDSGRPETSEFFGSLLEALSSGRKGWLVTVAPPAGDAGQSVGQAARPVGGAAPHVRRCLVDADGSVCGDQFCSPDELRTLVLKGGTYDGVVETPTAITRIQEIGGRGTAYVFGAGHCGEKLVPVLGLVGFATVVIDDREDFANAERFPTADRIVVPESFSGVVATLEIDSQGYVVIVTRGHGYDKDVLAQALATPARYIGMIGSRAKVAGALEALRKEGFSDTELARIHAPIGLAIGAETPEEIAISIAAQMIQVRAGQEA